jgi:hypothetical protein
MRLLLLLSALLWLMAPALHARTISWFNPDTEVKEGIVWR